MIKSDNNSLESGNSNYKEKLNKNTSSTQSEDNVEEKLLDEFFKPNSQLRKDVKRFSLIGGEQQAWEHINKVSQLKAKQRRRRRLITYASAACITLLIGISTLLYNKIEKVSHNLEAENSLVNLYEPGVKRATLEMSDGSIMELGSTEWELKEKDNTTIKVKDGQTELIASKKTSKGEILYNTIRVDRGAEFLIVLSDGTSVYLNSESKITYPTIFTGNERRIKIEGEAYIDVAKNEKQPFYVETAKQTIMVLGTSFNISAYSDDDEVVTTLISGSVQIEAGENKTKMTPGMQSVFNNKSENLSVRKVDAAAYAAWTKGVFVFFDDSVEAICKKLSRWYDIEIDASSPSLKNKKFSGIVKRYETFNEIAELVRSTNEIVFKEQNGKIIVQSARLE